MGAFGRCWGRAGYGRVGQGSSTGRAVKSDTTNTTSGCVHGACPVFQHFTGWAGLFLSVASSGSAVLYGVVENLSIDAFALQWFGVTANLLAAVVW